MPSPSGSQRPRREVHKGDVTPVAAEEEPLPSRPAKRRKQEAEQVPLDDEALASRITQHLRTGDEPVQVSKDHANAIHEEAGTDGIRAYAKIAGRDWAFFVTKLVVNIGRSPEKFNDVDDEKHIHINLGPARIVSRNHAAILFDTKEAQWYLRVMGRNGVKVNGTLIKPTEGPHCLLSGEVLEIGGVEMMFVLPTEITPLNFDSSILERCGLSAEALSTYTQRRQSRVIAAAQDQNRPGTPSSATRPGTSTLSQKPGLSKSVTVVGADGVDLSQDENQHIKPRFGYAQMITQAIISNPDSKLHLSGIYDYIMTTYSYYRHQQPSGWQNSIRHNLSLNKNFEKAARSTNELGKGMKWQLVPEAKDKMVDAAWRVGRGGRDGSSAPSSPRPSQHMPTSSPAPFWRSSEIAPPAYSISEVPRRGITLDSGPEPNRVEAIPSDNFSPEVGTKHTAAKAQAHLLGPPTDSGYATLRLQHARLGKNPSYEINDGSRRNTEEADDTATQYSDTSSLRLFSNSDYVTGIANHLLSDIDISTSNESAWLRILAGLSDALKDFALKIGLGKSQDHRNMMHFLHKHRGDITLAIESQTAEQNEGDDIESKDEPSWQERIGRWSVDAQFEAQWSEETSQNDTEMAEDKPPERGTRQNSPEEANNTQGADLFPDQLAIYLNLVSDTEAYQWLCARLRREARLTNVNGNTMDKIRNAIFSSLPSVRAITRHAPPPSHTASFELEWDILTFFEREGYASPYDEAFEKVITLTGSFGDAQALTCAQYLRQTWPVSADSTIALMKAVIRGGDGALQEHQFSDGTSATAIIQRPNLVVKAHGLAVSLAEIGEQLAWLGAALRLSSRSSGMLLCTPIITYIGHEEDDSQPSSSMLCCEMSFVSSEVVGTFDDSKGHCWHNLFKNPVVVAGYPIPCRTRWETGLELPLNMMIGLARARGIDEIHHRLCVKGFSTLLTPTIHEGDIIYWHLTFNRKGSRISYVDSSLYQEPELRRLSLPDLRHILGWSSQSALHAGSHLCEFPTDYKRLPMPGPESAFANAHIELKQVTSIGSPFIIGQKDTPAHVLEDDHIPRLDYISGRFILLWDADDKRGWLVNGTTALLHVLRAWLDEGSRNHLRHTLMCKNSDLKPRDANYSASSAFEILANPAHTKRPLYRGSEHTTLKSRVEQLCTVFEKLFELQQAIMGYSGEACTTPRGCLNGWDFSDLVTKKDRLDPCVVSLESAGKGWVDFIRSLDAVTLAGRGFGEMIKPVDSNLCSYWTELPKQQYYIAGMVCDLRQVIRTHSTGPSSTIQVSKSLIWHTPTTIFPACKHEEKTRKCSCEPVQTFFPSELSSRLHPRLHPIPSKGSEAFIFGQNSKFSWVWGDCGNPTEGPLQQPLSLQNHLSLVPESPHDSGIATSSAISGSAELVPPQGYEPTEPPLSFLGEHEKRQRIDDRAATSTYHETAYSVGIICALSKELKAVRKLFDDKHEYRKGRKNDPNQYALGRMGNHLVVAACLPHAQYGVGSAAVTTTHMTRSFTSLRFCLLVGIGGGVPSHDYDLRLGDVIVSSPTKKTAAVVQYDFGTDTEDSPFQIRASPLRPPRILNNVISLLRSDDRELSASIQSNLDTVVRQLSEYGYPGQDDAVQSCTECQTCNLAEGSPICLYHTPRSSTAPVVHYGPIASGNSLVRNSKFRDRIGKEHGVLCFEMEAAGVFDATDCLVIRGISDYTDSHKNDVWQNYAAATAAAYAKALLDQVGVEYENDGESSDGHRDEANRKRRRQR